MAKPPKNWPPGLLPARLDGACAAYFVGLSLTVFKQRVKERAYPQPVIDGGKKLWITAELVRVAGRGGVDSQAPSNEPRSQDEWLEELERDRAH